MKFHSFVLVVAVFSASAAAQSLPPGHPPVDASKQGKGGPEAPLPNKAKVVRVIDVPQYTYLEVTKGKKTTWLAATTVAVKKGDVVRFDEGMVMTNFQSKSLNRTFPSITFVNRVVVTKEKE
jgi:hypothetical protein